MEDKFQNKYRITSTRLQNWDYRWNAAYFVTICTHNRECYFGKIMDGVMELSAIGHIAGSCWHEIPRHFPFVKLGAHVIMPNHVHGIIIIDNTDNERNAGETVDGTIVDGINVETQNFASLQPLLSLSSSRQQQPTHRNTMNQFGPQSKNLASIIRGFKIGVTKNARQINPDFAWQSRFYDHIIRDEKSYQNISEYIINNPLKWNDDKSFPPNKTSEK